MEGKERPGNDTFQRHHHLSFLALKREKWNKCQKAILTEKQRSLNVHQKPFSYSKDQKDSACWTIRDLIFLLLFYHY